MTIQTTYTQARAQLAKLMDAVTQDRDIIVVERRGQPDVAMIAADELTALMETAYLLRSPQNAERLLTALNRALKEEGAEYSVADLREELDLHDE